MDNKKTPLATPPLAKGINPPSTPIDLTTPAPKPTTPIQPVVGAPVQQPVAPSQPPIEHDIASSSSLPTEQTISAPLSDPVPKISSVPPEAPAAIPNMPAPSSIPPMPSLDSLATAPSPLSNPAPTPVAAPIPNSVIDVSAPATTPSTPLDSTESAPIADSAAPVLTGPTASAETKPVDPTQPKKSKALVFVVIILALVALTLGGLVVWSAMQPKTSSIEESMTPPVMSENEEVGEITEEEVMVEQPDSTEDWEIYTQSDYDFSFKFPNSWEKNCQPDTEMVEWVSKNLCDFRAPGTLLDHGTLTDGAYLTVSVEKPSQNYSNLEQKKTYSVSEYEYSAQPKAVNNLDGYLLISKTGDQTFLFETQGVFISIGWAKPESNSPYSTAFGQILSTLSYDSNDPSTTPGAALQGSCTQDGETYADGDEVPAPDSCNSCSCENGQIACTAMACEE